MTAPPRSVLFACNHNTVRSPMAAALLDALTAGRVRAESCGVTAGETLDPFADAVLREAGLDPGGRRPQTFDPVAPERFDLVVSLTPEAEARAAELEGVARETWPCEDPTLSEGSREQRLEAFRRVRDDLRRRIAARFGPDAGP